jgi:hypothetical protein
MKKSARDAFCQQSCQSGDMHRLFATGHLSVQRRQHHFIIASDENEWHVVGVQCVCHGIAPCAAKIDVEYGGVDGIARLDSCQSMLDRTDWTHNLRANFFQPLRHIRCNHVIVFNNEEPAATQHIRWGFIHAPLLG